MLSKISGRMSSTRSNFHTLCAPTMMTDIGLPALVWYCAITWRQAPHGVAGCSVRRP